MGAKWLQHAMGCFWTRPSFLLRHVEQTVLLCKAKSIWYSNQTKGLRSRIRRLNKLPAPKLVRTTSEIQLTTFQQRQTISPDSSISNNCHVFMYLSPVDNRLSDIKEVHLFQPPYSFLAHLNPAIFFLIKWPTLYIFKEFTSSES